MKFDLRGRWPSLAALLLAPSAWGQYALNWRTIPPPPLAVAVGSKADLYGEAAMRQTNGPSYEFFRALLPPLHYVNADFRHYPIVLSPPRAAVKARLTSNGSGVNARANTRAWNETGTCVLFRVGNDELPFGDLLQRLDGPHLAEGYLPIVELMFQHGDGAYRQETFASTVPLYATNGVILSRFVFQLSDQPERSDKGRMSVRCEVAGPVRAEPGRLVNSDGEILLWFDPIWKWEPSRRVLDATFTNGAEAAVAVASVPMPPGTVSPLTGKGFGAQREHCVETWKGILARGMNVEVPEPVVNNAWRALVLANFSLINGDRMHYSAGNQYDKLYEHEGSDAAQALMMFGFEPEMRRLIVPLLDFTRKGLEYHQAGHKLDDVCRYYWQTRDAEFVKELRPRWQKEVDRLAQNRSPTNGLYPREQYCGDIPTPVFSMNSNSKGWRALCDVAALLDAIGDHEQGTKLREATVDFRRDILAAVKRSVPADLSPPFVPNALMGEEEPYDVITATKMGSYWNLMANTFLGTEVFGPGAELETGMLQYFQEHGGLFMGLLRSRPWPSFWASSANMNPLYGLRFVRTLLRRDEPDRALVSFYGMLAAGLTPETFVCGEGCSIEPLDQWGRQFYLPPNSAGNAFWLQSFRRLLVQDWDLDENGEPETLRLLFATPRRWLENGKTIKVERAPTAFGPLSVRAESRLAEGFVNMEVALPNRNRPKQTLLRARVPEGWRVVGATAGGEKLAVDENGSADLSSLKGTVSIRFATARAEPR